MSTIGAYTRGDARIVWEAAREEVRANFDAFLQGDVLSLWEALQKFVEEAPRDPETAPKVERADRLLRVLDTVVAHSLDPRVESGSGVGAY